MDVAALEERLEAGFQPKFVYVIPEFQNPSGRTLSLERRHALVETCRRHGVLIFEDVAYRELSFGGDSLPTLWSIGPDVVLQAGTFSKVFCPGVRLGWAPVPRSSSPSSRRQAQHRPVRGRARPADGRGVRPRRPLRARCQHARALYASHWAALSAALDAHMPTACTWSEPTGGMFTWLRLPNTSTRSRCAPAATAAGVAYVPGRPFYVTDDGLNELRLSFSALTRIQLAEAAKRLAAGVVAQSPSAARR